MSKSYVFYDHQVVCVEISYKNIQNNCYKIFVGSKVLKSFHHDKYLINMESANPPNDAPAESCVTVAKISKAEKRNMKYLKAKQGLALRKNKQNLNRIKKVQSMTKEEKYVE